MSKQLRNVLTDPARLQALAATQLLDSPAEETFDRLTRLAARSMSVPVALLSLVDDQRQFFKSSIGLPEPWASLRNTPLSHSFCQFAVAADAPLIIADARAHPLVATNPAIRDMQVIAYAGFPLRTPSGQVIGTLCAIDHQPRQWQAADLELLADLATIVNNEIERQQTTLALHHTTAQLAALLSQRTEVIWVVDRQLRLTLYNPMYLEFAQRFLRIVPVLGMDLAARLPAAMAETWQAYYARAFAGETFSIEESLALVEHRFWFETTFCPIFQGDEVVEVSLLARDITAAKTMAAERTQMLADARTAEQRMIATLERIHDAFFALDTAWNFIYLNSRAEELLQREAAELIGRSFWDVYPDALHSPFLAPYQAAIERGEPAAFEAYYLPLHTWFDVRLYPGHDGISVYFHDVTARHHLEAQNRIQARALDAIMQAVVVVDQDIRLIYQNAAAVALFGSFADPATFSVYALVAPTAHHAVDAVVANSRKGMAQIIELDLMRADGATFPALVTTAPIMNESGQSRQIVVVVTDLTEQKQAEQERLHMERDLLESQRLESLGLLAGGVAHDFNNLLMVMMGHANLARVELGPASPVSVNLEEIIQVAQRAADLTRQMLAYAGKGRVVLEPVDVSTVITEMTALVRASLPTPIPVFYTLAANLPLIEADAAQIRQVVLNLVLNAAEAMTSPTGRIDVRTTYSAESLPAVVLEVADTGSGITPEVQERIFDPFFTTKFTGRGLGLAAVQGVVRQHHGSITVQSVLGQGTCFRVTFPVPPTALVPLIPSHVAAAEIASVSMLPNVLVIDDEVSVRSITERMLRRWGYHVLGAESGTTAVQLLRSTTEPIAVALVDWTMPGLHGVALLQELLAAQPALQLVVMSGYSEDVLRSEIPRDLSVVFLHKPFSADQLRALLASLHTA